ncbi:MAG: thioesterase family protein [Woeseiaceae bacterium]|nr:thioesterase family protein [Woeseiaceae bacterium]
MELIGTVGERVSKGIVVPEWIDVNGHMNVAYYVLAFDRAVDDLWARLGITDDYIRSTRGSTFAVESHVTWQRELKEADPYLITSQLVAYDAKRIHQFQRMYHGEEHYLAATGEWLNLHVDLEARRVSPWPDDILDNLAACMAQHRELPLPPELGKRMHVREPLGQVEGYPR